MVCPYCQGNLGLKIEVLRYYSLDKSIEYVGEDGKIGPPTFILDSYIEDNKKFLYPSIECMSCKRKFYEAGTGSKLSDDRTQIVLPNFTKNKLTYEELWSGYYCSPTPKTSDNEKFVLKERPKQDEHANDIG